MSAPPCVDNVLTHHMSGGFVMEHATFLGGAHVIEETKTDGGADLLSCRAYTPTKAGGTLAFDSVDEKHDGFSFPDKSREGGTAMSVSSFSSCSVSSGSPAEEVAEPPRPALVVIDNDECIGSWGECPAVAPRPAPQPPLGVFWGGDSKPVVRWRRVPSPPSRRCPPSPHCR